MVVKVILGLLVNFYFALSDLIHLTATTIVHYFVAEAKIMSIIYPLHDRHASPQLHDSYV